jgi:transposase
MYTVGCDQHKNYCYMVALNEDNTIVNKQRIDHDDRERLTTYFKELPEKSQIAIEACGYEAWLCDLAESCGLDVHLAHPLKTKAIAEAKIKTDKIDAITLAQLLSADLLPEAYFAPQEIRERRYLLRFRQYLVKQQTSVKNRIHSIVDRLGLERPKITDLFSPVGIQWLTQLELSDIYGKALTEHLAILSFTKEQIKKIEKQIALILKDDPLADILETVPGIGKFSAFLLLAEIGPIERFNSPDRLCAYAGLVPSVHQSGKTEYYGSITKQGNKFIRWILIEASQRAIKQDPGLLSFHSRIEFKKGRNTATVAVARKLLTYIYQVLSKKEPYKLHKSQKPVLNPA